MNFTVSDLSFLKNTFSGCSTKKISYWTIVNILLLSYSEKLKYIIFEEQLSNAIPFDSFLSQNGIEQISSRLKREKHIKLKRLKRFFLISLFNQKGMGSHNSSLSQN